MDASSTTARALDTKLGELAEKATIIEGLAGTVKANEKKLLDLANSTLSYISQLKANYRSKSLSSNALADKLFTTMDNIARELQGEPTKTAIDKTIQDLENVLQSKPSGVGAAARSRVPAAAAQLKKQGEGLLSTATENINKLASMLTGDDDDPSAPERLSSETSPRPPHVGGFRYSTPKRSSKKELSNKAHKKSKRMIRRSNRKTLSRKNRMKPFSIRTKKRRSKN